MPPAKAKGKERAGARQNSEPASYLHCFCTVLINPCVRHSYFIMARLCAGKAPTSEIKKKKVKAKSPVTGQEEGPRVKTRAAVAWGMAKSPGGTEHRFIANSGITPDGANDEVKARSCAVLSVIPASLGALRPDLRSSRTLPSPCASESSPGAVETSQEVVPPATGRAASTFCHDLIHFAQTIKSITGGSERGVEVYSRCIECVQPPGDTRFALGSR